MKIEYRVRETTRYIVTRYEEDEPGSGSVRTVGEYPSAETAYDIAYALCREEHRRLEWPIDDERIQYPRHPGEPGKLVGEAGQA